MDQLLLLMAEELHGKNKECKYGKVFFKMKII